MLLAPLLLAGCLDPTDLGFPEAPEFDGADTWSGGRLAFERAKSNLEVTPSAIEFPPTVVGETSSETLEITNASLREVALLMAQLQGDVTPFSVKVEGQPPDDVLPKVLGLPLPPDVDGRDRDGTRLQVELTYAPEEPGRHEADMRLFVEARSPREVRVELEGVAIEPCVRLRQRGGLGFGSAMVGASLHRWVDVENCGTEDFQVLSAQLDPAGSPAFTVSERPAGLDEGCLDDPQGSCEGHFGIPPEASQGFGLVFAPETVGEHEGTLVVTTGLPGQERVEIALSGRGVENEAPRCVAQARIVGEEAWAEHPKADEPLRADLGAVVQLRGTDSVDPDGFIADQIWSLVEAPRDSESELVRSGQQGIFNLKLDALGAYVFALSLTDDRGLGNAEPCLVHVRSEVSDGIEIRLTWDTPADPNQLDTGFGAGADVDLHLLHPLGDWGCAPRDVSYSNPNPDWGAPANRADDPTLQRDDTDGAGPEVIVLDEPEDDRVYRVGVHYLNDHGYGPSFASVEIYAGGVLRQELRNRRLKDSDTFWDVATIAWPSGDVLPVDQVLDAMPDGDCP